MTSSCHFTVVKKMYKLSAVTLSITKRGFSSSVPFIKQCSYCHRFIKTSKCIQNYFYSKHVTKDIPNIPKKLSKFNKAIHKKEETTVEQQKDKKKIRDSAVQKPPGKMAAVTPTTAVKQKQEMKEFPPIIITTIPADPPSPPAPPRPAQSPQLKKVLDSVTDGPQTPITKVFLFDKELEEDAKAEEEQQKERARSWQTLKYSLIALGVSCTCAMSYALIFFGKPKIDENGEMIVDEFSDMSTIRQYFHRSIAELHYYNKLIKEPSRDKLLPEVLKAPYYQPPYTLILEFTDVLVHPEWTYNTGWRFKKRPGLDQFLEALYTRYEMVVYTAEMGMTVFPIMDALDKNNMISYKLVRDATNFVEGHHVKDLDKLNRNLSKVIVVDWNPESTKLHTDNLFKIPRWDGNDHDTTLFDLAAFLTAISEWEIEDVRTVLRYYGQFDNPLGMFKERQREWLAQH